MTQAVTSRGAMTFEKSVLAQARLHQLIPGGAHTYARGSDQFPENMTPILVRGRGARVEDLDGNWLIEYGMGLRSVTLGHGYQPVVAAVSDAAADGVNFSRPSIWELRAAEDFLQQLPGMDMVKFAKNGSDATTAAVKLARAATGRDLVAICGSQPFFSIDVWIADRDVRLQRSAFGAGPLQCLSGSDCRGDLGTSNRHSRTRGWFP
jgi:glutamate-1-semialdehyde 2,1-aminomutase